MLRSLAFGLKLLHQRLLREASVKPERQCDGLRVYGIGDWLYELDVSPMHAARAAGHNPVEQPALLGLVVLAPDSEVRLCDLASTESSSLVVAARNDTDLGPFLLHINTKRCEHGLELLVGEGDLWCRDAVATSQRSPNLESLGLV